MRSKAESGTEILETKYEQQQVSPGITNANSKNSDSITTTISTQRIRICKMSSWANYLCIFLVFFICFSSHGYSSVFAIPLDQSDSNSDTDTDTDMPMTTMTKTANEDTVTSSDSEGLGKPATLIFYHDDPIPESAHNYPSPSLSLFNSQEQQQNLFQSQRSISPSMQKINNKNHIIRFQQKIPQQQQQPPSFIVLHDARARRNSGSSLSIVNPLDVLRQRLLLEIGRRRLQSHSQQVNANSEYLKTIGKKRRR